MKTQYWMLNKYNGDVLHKNPLWELSKGEYKNEGEVRKAYAARAKSLNYEIVELRPHEQFEFKLED